MKTQVCENKIASLEMISPLYAIELFCFNYNRFSCLRKKLIASNIHALFKPEAIWLVSVTLAEDLY